MLDQNVSLLLDDLAREAVRLFGMARVGRIVSARVREAVGLLEASGRCRIEGDRIALS